jgi:omega-hydroxypalmitate O-feruloyl transferase
MALKTPSLQDKIQWSCTALVCSSLYACKLVVRSALDWWEVYRGVPPIIGDTFYMTSWLKMPFYSIDFGWGTPLYSGPVASQMVEFIVLFPNGKNDGGINMILSLPPPVMAKFEQYVKVRL